MPDCFHSPLSPAAVEVDAVAASLSSSDCFVLERAAAVGAQAQEPVMLWLGRGSSAAEQEAAVAVAAALSVGGAAVERVEVGVCMRLRRPGGALGCRCQMWLLYATRWRAGEAQVATTIVGIARGG